jgi:hypothetical protein|tara:strand:- start:2148 stop:3884 length:1737 start_codon:yes stop_codon:yes gene_type:complete
MDDKKMNRIFAAVGMEMERHSTPLPSMPLFTAGIQEPPLLQGITIPALYAAAYECMVLRSILQHLSVETFRKGWQWKPKFVSVCTQCSQKFQQEHEICPTCQGEARRADRNQIEYAEEVIGGFNRMTQNFIEVMREVEMDLNIVDDAYLILTKEYFIDPKSKQPMFYRIKEVSRADPIFMRILADKRGVRGGSQYTSIVDRSFRSSDKDAKCPKTGMPVVPIHYMNLAGVGNGQVYIEGEVIHISKWSPSKLYGRSPIATMWRQVNTLIAMDNYVYSAYQKRRMPRGVMVIKSSNMETVERTARNIQEHLERDPNYVPTIGVETETGRGGLEYVRMMDTLEELQYIPIKDDIRQRISAFYGVSNVFMNDVSGGGLSNEGMQIVVSNRSVSYSQSIYNRLLFPLLLSSFGIDEWEITLNPHEEEDEIMQLRRDEMAIRNMMQMKQSGYNAHLRDSTDDKYLVFEYSEPSPEEIAAAQEAQAAQQQGGGSGEPVQKGGSLNAALITTNGTELPPISHLGQSQRKSGGESPEHIKRNEGGASRSNTKGDSRDMKTPAEKRIDEKLRNVGRAGQRGMPKEEQ